MKLERLLGLLAMTGITLLALFLFFPSRHTDDISTVDPSTKTDLEQPILSVTKDFKILSESNFDFMFIELMFFHLKIMLLDLLSKSKRVGCLHL